MKIKELQAVHTAIKTNIELLIKTKGESPLVGLEGFTEPMLNKFDALWDTFAPKEYDKVLNGGAKNV